MKKVLLLNGPNLNLLGTRQPDLYGARTLEQILAKCQVNANALNLVLTHFQSNIEGELVNRIHQAKTEEVDFIIINPGAFTHTSIALRDAFLGVDIPFVEVHLSNVYAREAFRHISYLSDIATGVITGLGDAGYDLALSYIAKADC